MSLQRYEEYKNSGVTWLGDIPTEWHVRRIKHTTYLKGRVGWKGLTSDEYLDSGYAYLVTGTDFSKKFINWRECHYVEQARYEDDPFIQLRDGDLLITKDGTIGKLALVSALDRPACLNSGIFLIRPASDYVTEYMYWVLQSEDFKVFCDLSSLGSTIQHLYQNVFEDFAFPVPSLQEQLSIAAFLDREIAKIDLLIAEQEKLIALLAEKRQATIARAVMCGLNLEVQMKDVAVEWLGKMPEHWKIITISKATTKITNGYVGPTRDILVDEGIPYVQATHVKKGRVNFGNDYFVDTTWSQCHAKSILREDDVLIVQTGAGTGDVGLVSKNESGFNCHALIILSTDKSKMVGAYLAAVLHSPYGRAKLASIQTGAMHPHLNCGEVKFVEVPVPPLSEQLEIVNFLDTETRKLETLEAEVASAISLLNERRRALITAAVTGQIDVRGIKPQTAVVNL
jgi:type I restriction enzyme S subunit